MGTVFFNEEQIRLAIADYVWRWQRIMTASAMIKLDVKDGVVSAEAFGLIDKGVDDSDHE